MKPNTLSGQDTVTTPETRIKGKFPGLSMASAAEDPEGSGSMTAYVDGLGRLLPCPTKMRARVVEADEEAIVLSASGMEARVGWSTLSPRRFYGVVRKYTDDHKALAAYCRGMGLLKEAEVEEGEE